MAIANGNQGAAVVPETLDTIPQWDPVTVSVTINFSDVCLLPVPSYWAGKHLQRSAAFRVKVRQTSDVAKVSISVPYSNVSLGVQWFLQSSTVSAASVLPADLIETPPPDDDY